MPTIELLSSTEQKLFAGIALLICCLCFANLTNKIIDAYNRAVEAAEATRVIDANNGEQITFAADCFHYVPLYESILSLQYILAPLLFGYLLNRKKGGFVISMLLTLLMVSGYLGWLYRTYSAIKSNRSYSLENTNLKDFLFYNSTTLEFCLFFAFSVLFILQISILARCVVNRFAAGDYLS